MKKVLFGAVIICSLIACKKKADPLTFPAGTGTAASKHFTAIVNGSNFAADSYSPAINLFNPGKFSISGTSGTAIGSPLIKLNGDIQTGSYALNNSNSLFTATYMSNFISYTALSGNITIYRIDTLAGHIKNFTASFNFNTDTIFGNHYTVNSGDVNYFE